MKTNKFKQDPVDVRYSFVQRTFKEFLKGLLVGALAITFIFALIYYLGGK